MMSDWQLAQINVGTTIAPVSDPALAGFVAQLDAINALADRSPGFVWRLQTEQGNATGILMTDDPCFILNMSVWTGIEALFEFAYRSAHRGVMVQRREWFRPPAGPYQALWWVRAGHRPAAEEGLAKLRLLEAHGPTAAAFFFRTAFPHPAQAPAEPTDLRPEPYCVGWG